MSQTYSDGGPATSRVRGLLLVTWAAFTAAAVGFVVTFGTNAPYADEWEFVPALVGDEPALPWVWKQHNEHRMVLSRLVYYPLFQLTRDFRTGMLLQVALLSALALGLMSLAARLRGRPVLADVFFPVTLLHLGHWENFIMGYQLCFALFTVLVTGLVVVALRATRESAFPSGVAAGALGFLVALTGGSGLVAAVPVSVWVAYLAVVVARRGGYLRALVLAGFALLPLLYTGVYFIGYEKPPHHPPLSRDPVAVAMVTGEVIATALGIGASGVWPAAAVAILGLLVASTVLMWRRSADHTATVGVAAVLLGVCGVALAIGFGRGSMGTDMGLWSRYSLLTWPLLGGVYLAWAAAGRKWVPLLICTAAAFVFPANLGTGMLMGANVHEHYVRLTFAATAGAPAELIVEQLFPDSPNAGQVERALSGIPLLRAANVGIFATGGRTGPSWGDWLLPALAVGLLVLGARWVWRFGRAVAAERARELFRLQHERYEEQLVAAAGATGTPRGLTWVKCQITGDAVLVRDLVHGGIAALVPVVVEFEPVPGSDMENHALAREPRPATAVFAFDRGTWTTSGRVVFNHTPDQTVAAFAQQFRVIPHGQH